MSKIIAGLTTLVLISSLLMSSVLIASTTNTYFIDYTITYHSHYSGKYLTSSCKESVINLNITSTKISENKYNNTITITGYIYTNSSSPFMMSVNNMTIHHTFNFTTKFPLVKEITIFNISRLLNITLNISKELKVFNITINYKVNYQPNGTEKTVFNNKTYTLDSFKAFLSLAAEGHNKYFNTAYSSTMEGNILTFQKGIFYKLYLTGESYKNITISNFMNIYSKGNTTLCVILKNTNIKLDSVTTHGMDAPTTNNSANNGQTEIKPEEFLIPAGIIALIAAGIILIRKF
ncbi:hypothetical protein [Acidianus sp. HS-5]|uniref:hypothetical protein n=1 Tax=Acidianus sp. HS-5 TaxID=2886040 RepID=UPI001F285192|nr:hypothetical protein [Acidianus sp. HS-5]BDC19527.1 hypothetical protein HS5_24170 [Acidianus sp. HS-5]